MTAATRRRRARGALCALVVLVSIVAPGAPPPASAQAGRVNVSVRTSPALPEPGDDVSARVSVSGCPPGPALIETYLTFDDGATQTSVRVERTTARTSLLFSSTTTVVLRKAIEGWYGVRVVCGEFRPLRAPMTNTLFVVGARPTKTSQVDAPTAVVGSTIGYRGTGCTGARIEYAIFQVERNATAFTRAGDLPVRPDGTWSGAVPVPPALRAGPVRLAARCVHELSSGDKAYVYYDEVDVSLVAR